MSEIDDGGPAFPRSGGMVEGPNSAEWVTPETGMSLRDYFAAHAPEPTDDDVKRVMDIERMQNPHNEPYHNKVRRRPPSEIKCSLRYDFADAMIQARKVKP